MVPQERLVTRTPLAGPVVPPVGTRPTRRSGLPRASAHSISDAVAPTAFGVRAALHEFFERGIFSVFGVNANQVVSVGTRACSSGTRSR